MSHLDIASQQFATVVRTLVVPAKPVDAFPPEMWDGLQSTLLGDIVTGVAPIWSRPSFQALATTPQRTLPNGCNSPERGLIEKVRDELVAATAAVRRFLQSNEASVRSALPRTSARLRFASSDGMRNRELTFAGLMHQLDGCEAPIRTEWVSMDDYFRPTHETLIKCDDGTILQRSELIVSIQPELTELGNVMARCLMVRMGTALRAVDMICRDLFVLLQEIPGKPTGTWLEPLRIAKRSAELLRNLCLSSPAAHLVESSITLAQLNVGLAADQPDCEWLNLPPEIVAAGRREVRLMLEHRLQAGTANRIQEALQAVADHYRNEPAEQSAVEQAIASGGLVVIESTKQVYWETKPIEKPWSKRGVEWRLLSALAKSRGLVDIELADVSDDAESESTLPNMKYKLRKLIPPSLSKHIIPGHTNKPGTYRLDLPGRIRYFE